jgi:hypothetical protein
MSRYGPTEVGRQLVEEAGEKEIERTARVAAAKVDKGARPSWI